MQKETIYSVGLLDQAWGWLAPIGRTKMPVGDAMFSSKEAFDLQLLADLLFALFPWPNASYSEKHGKKKSFNLCKATFQHFPVMSEHGQSFAVPEIYS